MIKWVELYSDIQLLESQVKTSQNDLWGSEGVLEAWL